MPVDVEFAVETSQQKLCDLGLGFGVLFRIEASWPSFMCVAQGRGVAFAELSVGMLARGDGKTEPEDEGESWQYKSEPRQAAALLCAALPDIYHPALTFLRDSVPP